MPLTKDGDYSVLLLLRVLTTVSKTSTGIMIMKLRKSQRTVLVFQYIFFSTKEIILFLENSHKTRVPTKLKIKKKKTEF